ncbi:histidine phosphatase family protein [Pseudodesulfovibrio sp.]|uniref:SixA phosphatase family protein n=1 Tax=Pseudodesulfovibrio sp. TaxID=2035812 RepID=UPI0026069845|nr:histidine phosphatase family protein [Pseudodesulfovibrio sp.]MDD3310852.1 histidine phosphatase family protein [Pseudodesulfovibrio sp.]
MLIHLMQHGACLSEQLDPNQPLSPVGREIVEKTARAAAVLGLRFELIVASPKLRSRQTAEIMARATGYPVSRIQVTEAAKAMAPARETIDFIKEYQGLESVLVTGHLPSLTKVAAALLTGGTEPAVHIENAGLTQLDLPEKGNATLNWHLTPAQLTLIAG